VSDKLPALSADKSCVSFYHRKIWQALWHNDDKLTNYKIFFLLFADVGCKMKIIQNIGDNADIFGQ